MLSCKEAARLVSEQLDRKLPFWRRASLRLHVFICRACTRYARQLRALDQAVSRKYREGFAAESPEHLSPQAIERIKTSLRSPGGGPSSQNLPDIQDT
jgi:hypothetical protein